MDFLSDSVVKNLLAVGDLGSIPGSERFPGERNGNPLQCSCLENPMDSGAWRPTDSWGRKETDTTIDSAHAAWYSGTMFSILQ